MENFNFKEKIQIKAQKIGRKQGILGDDIGISNKSTFSNKLTDPTKFTSKEITKLSEILGYKTPFELMKDTEIECDKVFIDILNPSEQKDCQIKNLKIIIEELEEETSPIEYVSWGLFSGIVITVFLFFIAKFL